jgi:hypothetical protein
MTIKAKAFKEGMIDSDTATATYSINIISPSSLGGYVPPAVMYAAIIIAVAANLVVLVMLLKMSKRKSPSKNA